METIAAARTEIKLWYNDVDISADVAPMLVSFEYHDFASGQVDDLQVSFKDPDRRWLNEWYPDEGARLRAAIIWTEDNITRALPCGEFVIDTPQYSHPGVITLKGTAASVTTSLRRQKRTREWRAVTLKAIAKKIAEEQGVIMLFQGSDTPVIAKVQQKDESDLKFLLEVCEREGYGLKVESNRLVVYPRDEFDSNEPVRTIELGSSAVLGYQFTEDKVNTYKACKVRYKHPDKGYVEVTYTPHDAVENGQVLVIRTHVGSEAEALRIAKAKLDLANRSRISCEMELVGDVRLVSGVNVTLAGWGVLDGKYAIDEATHTKATGYRTKLKMIKVIE